jgi:hypothetical protein
VGQSAVRPLPTHRITKTQNKHTTKICKAIDKMVINKFLYVVIKINNLFLEQKLYNRCGTGRFVSPIFVLLNGGGNDNEAAPVTADSAEF